MDEIQENTFYDTIHFGDKICLYSDESAGFVFSNQTSSVHTELGIGKSQSLSSPNLSNPQALVFQICAQNRYKISKQYAKTKEKLKLNPHDFVLLGQCNQLQNASEMEDKENLEEQNRHKGKCLLYGQIVQLHHHFTGKYLHINPSQTSWTETSNMMVALNSLNRKSAMFKVHPRFKVKSEGEIVKVHDQIMLESIKSPGQFLHCSRNPFNQMMVYESSFELNLSVEKAGFTVHKYCYVTNQVTEQRLANKAQAKPTIHAGSYVGLYHRELEAYLAAEGLFGYKTIEEPHLRIRSVNPTRMNSFVRPASSAALFWQMEIEASTIDGSPIRWEQQCRLRHVTTRKYLKIDEKLNASMTDEVEDPATVFKIFAVAKISDNVTYDSYARFQHVVSRCWLANMGTQHFMKDEKQGTTSPSQKHQWSKAELIMAGANNEMVYDDAFSLQEVQPEREFEINYVAGMAPFLCKFIKDALKELSEFMIVNGQPKKSRQKLLRNFMIVDLLVEVLQFSASGNENEKMLVSIYSQCYNVLSIYLKGSSSKNALYLARHLEFLINQLDQMKEISVNAALMIKELLVDNRKMIDSISKSHIVKFCTILRNSQDHRYVGILIALCTCNGIALSDNQNFIAQKCLIEPCEDKEHTIYYLNVGKEKHKESTHNISLISMDGKKSWQPIQLFAPKSDTERTAEQLFLEYQLNLFSGLCFGRNENSRFVITEQLKLVTWKIAFLCLCDDMIRDGLRAAFCKIIFDLFIDIGENLSVMDNVNMVFVYNDVPLPGVQKGGMSGLNQASTSTAKQTFINELKIWISGFLHGNQNLIASQIQTNKLISSVLNMVYKMAKFGFYGDANDIQKLIEPLFGLLDGNSDLPFALHNDDMNATTKELVHSYQQKGRYQLGVETSAIVDVKFEILRLCDLLFIFRFNTRLERFVSEFKMVLTKERNSGSHNPALGPLLYNSFKMDDSSKMFSLTVTKTMQRMFAETKYFSELFIDILMARLETCFFFTTCTKNL